MSRPTNPYNRDQLKAILDASQIAWNPLQLKSLKRTLKKGLYEVYFLMVSLPETKEAFWIRYTLLIPMQIPPRFVTPENFPPSSPQLPAMLQNYSGAGMLWCAYFSAHDPDLNFVVKQPYSLADISSEMWVVSSQGLPKGSALLQFPVTVLRMGDASLWLDGAAGTIDLTPDDVGRPLTLQNPPAKIHWDLKFEGYEPPYHHVPTIAKHLGLIRTIPETIHPNIQISGEVTFNLGEKTFAIDGASGTLTHIIGRRYDKTWAWAHCNAFAGSPGAFFELSCLGKLATFGFYDGKDQYFFNRVQAILHVKCNATLNALEIRASGKKARVEGKISVPTEFLLGVEYFGPAGERMYCYNSEIASSEFRIYEVDKATGQERLVQDLISDCTTAFETTYFQPVAEASKLLRWEDISTT
jgi:hypothetical protein